MFKRIDYIRLLACITSVAAVFGIFLSIVEKDYSESFVHLLLIIWSRFAIYVRDEKEQNHFIASRVFLRDIDAVTRDLNISAREIANILKSISSAYAVCVKERGSSSWRFWKHATSEKHAIQLAKKYSKKNKDKIYGIYHRKVTDWELKNVSLGR